MTQLGQAQTGSLRSTPKQLKVSASDKNAALFKNMGNNHNIPFMWCSTATVTSGTTETTVTSGVSFYEMELATYANVVATPTSDITGDYYLDVDTGTNVIKLVVGSAVSADVDFNVQFMLGQEIDITTLNTRGTGAPAQSYP